MPFATINQKSFYDVSDMVHVLMAFSLSRCGVVSRKVTQVIPQLVSYSAKQVTVNELRSMDLLDKTRDSAYELNEFGAVFHTSERFVYSGDEHGHFWLEQDANKGSKRGNLARQGHDVAWEFESPGGSYIGRMLIDGEIYTPSEATKTFLKPNPAEPEPNK